MELQYISDAAGNHTAVIIPIEDWEKLTDKYKSLKKIEPDSKKVNIADFAGFMPQDIADKMQAYVKESRESWG